jgi:DNA-binding transcriptional LysR family regulator
MKYFIGVADCRSFTKAAQLYYIAQTAMSQQIAAIEKEIGVILFVRDRKTVKLTPAGETFYQNCKRIVDLYERALEQAKLEQAGQTETISLGIVTQYGMDYLYEIIKQFRMEYPNSFIRLYQDSIGKLREKMITDDLDACLAVSYDLEGIDNVRIEPLGKLKMGFLVSKENPLAAKDEVFIRELESEDIVSLSRAFGPGAYEYMMSQRQKEGIVPHVVEEANTLEILAMLVKANRGGAFLPETAYPYDRISCKMLRIVDSDDTVTFSIAWNEASSVASLHPFVEAVKSYIRGNTPVGWMPG